MDRLTNNQADYACPHCGSRDLAFLGIGLVGRLKFRCKADKCGLAGHGFQIGDAEGKYLHPKIASLKERYPG